MNRVLKNAIIGIGLASLAAGVNAQDWRYRDRDDYRYNEYRQPYGREPLDRVRADLDRAANDLFYLSRDDMRRFQHVREEIAEFQSKWERGWFDRRELDDVIVTLQRVVEYNRLRPVDRDLLANDLYRLREIRERNRGYVNGGNGYREPYRRGW
jgi:hypothetical protein